MEGSDTAMIGAVFGAIFGAGFGILGNIFFQLKNQDVQLINDHIDGIYKIDGLAAQYWLGESDNLPALAARISGTMSASGYFLSDAVRLLGNKYTEFRRLDGELYDLITGGSFQTTDHEADFNRATEIIAKCNEMRSLLRNSRWSIYWSR